MSESHQARLLTFPGAHEVEILLDEIAGRL